MSPTHDRSLLTRAAALATVLPLAGGLVVLSAPPAAAAVSSPADGAVVDTYREVDITADYGPASSGTTERLLLTSPGGTEVELATQPGSFTGGTLSYRLNLGCWTGECRRAPNGTWTIRQEGGTSDTGTFVTRIAPDAPKDVAASAVGPREAKVTWRLGAEPDLVGWDVYEGSAKVQGVDGSACAGDVCSTVISYAAAGSGNHTYTVRALRSTAPGASTTITSPASAPASVTLAEPAAPAPTGSGTPSTRAGSGAQGDGGPATDGSGAPASGGAAGGGSPAPIGTGSAPGSATAEQQEAAQRKAFALGFSTFGPKLGIPKLPPLPQGQPPAIAPELADGTYEPTLGFQDQVLTERVEVAQGPTRRVRNVVGTALDSERLATSTAGALVLLLAGAHLRRWLGASAEDEPA